MERRSIDELLEQARAGLDRLSPEQALAEARDADAVLVDLRERHQRAAAGAIPGAIAHSRLVIEWRADPAGEWRDDRIADPDRRVILFATRATRRRWRRRPCASSASAARPT